MVSQCHHDIRWQQRWSYDDIIIICSITSTHWNVGTLSEECRPLVLIFYCRPRSPNYFSFPFPLRQKGCKISFILVKRLRITEVWGECLVDKVYCQMSSLLLKSPKTQKTTTYIVISPGLVLILFDNLFDTYYSNFNSHSRVWFKWI